MEARFKAGSSGIFTGSLLMLLLWLLVMSGPAAAQQTESSPHPQEQAQETQRLSHGAEPMDCEKVIQLLEQQRGLIAREAGQIRRELSAMREDLSKPGLKEIFAGIGYIFGLTGIAFYMHSRRKERPDQTGR